MFQNEVDFSFDRSKILGSGVYGSVYEGSFEGKTVAVKRTHIFYVNDLITKDEFLKNIRHSNLVMLLHIAKDQDFRQVKCIHPYISLLHNNSFSGR
jgi:hypothetical protein